MVCHVAASVRVVPMDKYLANLDALAASTQCILHRFTAPDDGDAAEFAREGEAFVALASGCANGALVERQGGQRVLEDEAEEAVAIKDKVVTLGLGIADDGVHAAGLEVTGEYGEIAVCGAEVVLTEFGTDVLDDEVDGNGVLAAGPRDDDVGEFLGGKDVGVEHGLDKLGVLLDDAFDVAAALGGVTADATGEADVIVGVNEDAHVALLPDIGDAEDEDALKDDDVGGVYDFGLVGLAGVGGEVIHRKLGFEALLKSVEGREHGLGVDGFGVVEVIVGDVILLLLAKRLVEGVLGDECHLRLLQLLHDAVAHRRLP